MLINNTDRYNKNQMLCIFLLNNNLTLDLQSNAKFVLVVEKDATFQKLLDDNIYDKLPPCIIITVSSLDRFIY